MTEPSKELTVQRDTELDRYARLGQWLAASESGGQDVKALGASAALRLFYAHELGLPPLAAAELSVIKGRLFVGAKLLRALAARHGYRVKRVDSDDKACTAVLVDTSSGEEVGRSTFTFEMAKTAGLVKERSVWQTHPARMLWARASKFVLDDYAPEVTLGLGTDDELAEITNTVVDVDSVEIPPVHEDPAFYSPDPATERQLARIRELLEEKQGVVDEDDVVEAVSELAGREFDTLDELGMAEATAVIAILHETPSVKASET